MLHLLQMWLKVPVEERDETGKKRLTGGKDHDRGTPQGGVISPLLANPYADDFVILSRGKAAEALGWAHGTLTRLGLTLNERKTSIRNTGAPHSSRIVPELASACPATVPGRNRHDCTALIATFRIPSSVAASTCISLGFPSVPTSSRFRDTVLGGAGGFACHLTCPNTDEDYRISTRAIPMCSSPGVCGDPCLPNRRRLLRAV
jgi:hypothetical protein